MVKKAFLIFLTMLMLTTFLFPFKTVYAAEHSGEGHNPSGRDPVVETETGETGSDSFISGADNFLNMGKDNYENAVNTENLKSASDLIYNTLLIIGTCLAVIMGAVLGLQFIMGSVEQKVKVKESLIAYVVGCIVLFGAFGIWRLVILLLK